MKTKRFIAVLLAATLLSFSTCGFAESDITVILNGETMEFTMPPQFINDRTMVPMRTIFEALGCQVNWVEEHQLIISVCGDTIISMMIDKPNMPVQNLITGEQKIVVLDSPPVLINDTTLVPVRAVSEALGANVEWIGETNTVVITTE